MLSTVLVYTKECYHMDITVAILVSQDNEQEARCPATLVSLTNPMGVELFSYVNTFFGSNKFAWLLDTLLKTICRRRLYT